MSGYLLILTILLLGSGIAALGDRLGFKVGKARLSVFGLRPKYTAVVVTLLTGFTVSAVTIGVILLVNEQVRVGLFELDTLLNNLQQAKTQQAAVRQELTTARTQQARAEQQLRQINQQLQQAQTQQKAAEARRQALQQGIIAIQRQAETAEAASQRKLAQAQNQVQALKTEEIRLLNRQKALLVRNKQLSQSLAFSSARYLDLRNKASELVNYGDFIFQAGDVVSAGIVRTGLTSAQQQAALDNLFFLAEQDIRKQGSAPYGTDRALLIPAEVVAQLRKALTTEQASIVQLIATRNILRGEPTLVTARVLPNSVLFGSGEVMATQRLTLPRSESELRVTVEQLFEQASRKARDKGIFSTARGDVGYFPAEALDQLVRDLQRYQGEVVVQAVANQDIYRIGPLTLSLVGLQDGRVITRAT
ncbi:DUF3084 domain-containing protein [Candidatus Cyanaurora vandensis]|uniref:DUF3084 domain-containing protein n=1 Tax=Candidatus Cyanaurora vandensis TaxID=2714958 RepID=UPI00257B82B5|nr:DUF3084 domain-containing protein [Candidatus Cyanaurora vandensis]